jgi:hypothetical protein
MGERPAGMKSATRRWQSRIAPPVAADGAVDERYLIQGKVQGPGKLTSCPC